jgi:hypothetical protein
MPQFAGPAGGVVAHVPRVLPVATLHTPVQQSPLVAQASLAWAQNDDG